MAVTVGQGADQQAAGVLVEVGAAAVDVLSENFRPVRVALDDDGLAEDQTGSGTHQALRERREDCPVYAGQICRVVLARFQGEEGLAVFAQVLRAEGDGFHDFPAAHHVQHGAGARKR